MRSVSVSRDPSDRGDPARPLLTVRDLARHVVLARGVFGLGRSAGMEGAVNGALFTLAPGEVLVILGECGSGKSVTLRDLMRLLPPKRTVIEGSVRMARHDVFKLFPPGA